MTPTIIETYYARVVPSDPQSEPMGNGMLMRARAGAFHRYVAFSNHRVIRLDGPLFTRSIYVRSTRSRSERAVTPYLSPGSNVPFSDESAIFVSTTSAHFIPPEHSGNVNSTRSL
jgi:hypothetical protein